MKFTLLLTALLTTAQAARLTLNGGFMTKSVPKCGLDCLENIGCEDTIDAFSACIENKCEKDDPTVASAVEKYMAMCQIKHTDTETKALTHLKNLYLSSQMALLKRQAASVATNGTSGNSTNGSSNSTSSSTGTGTTGGSATTTRSGTYATSCSSLADVLDGTCVVRSSDANHNTRNALLVLLGSATLVAALF